MALGRCRCNTKLVIVKLTSGIDVLIISREHYDDVIMGAIASQITSLTIVYSAVYSGADQSKHQSSASLAFVWGIHRGPVNSPHKWPVTRKMFPFDDVIMKLTWSECQKLSLMISWHWFMWWLDAIRVLFWQFWEKKYWEIINLGYLQSTLTPGVFITQGDG